MDGAPIFEAVLRNVGRGWGPVPSVGRYKCLPAAVRHSVQSREGDGRTGAIEKRTIQRMSEFI